MLTWSSIYGLFCLLQCLLSHWKPISATVARNSAPFDPFRLECPFYHGIIKMELRRVDSIEGIRTDTMITAYCENVKTLHPSPRDRSSNANDESCRWTGAIKIPGKNLDVTEVCSGREFVAGISRQAIIGEYSILCCKLRDRKHSDCTTAPFKWPTALERDSTVEQGKFLLTSIGFQDGKLIGQFCNFGIMTRQELDAELANNWQALSLTQLGQDSIKKNNFTDGESGSFQQKISSNVRLLQEEETSSARPPETTRPKINQRPGAQRVISRKAPLTTAQAKQTSPRPQPTTTTAEKEEVEEEGEIGEVDGATNAEPGEAKNGVIRVISESGTTEGAIDGAPDTSSAAPGTDEQPTTTSIQITSSATESDVIVTTESSTAQEEVVQTTTEAVPSPAEGAEVETEATTASEQATGQDSKALEVEGELSETETDADVDAGETDTTPEGTSPPTKKTKKPNTTPAPTTTEESTIPTTSEPTNEPASDQPFGFTAPDPARFQVLGILRPPGPPPIRPRPHGLFLNSASVNSSKKLSSKKPTKPSSEKSPSPTSTPEPPGQTGGDGPGDAIELETTLEGTTPKGKGKQARKKTTAAPTTPAVVAGNLTAESIGQVISSGNISVESAVAPLTPRFGARSTTSTSTASTSPGEESASSAPPSSPQSSPTGDLAEISSTSSDTSTFVDAPGDAARVKCDTEHAVKDPSTNLVVACGQGNDIWSPPRCPANTFCLIAMDSIFRICCPVKVG